MKKNYTIGLDVGTNSVGWAVIDDAFELVKGKKTIKENGKVRKNRTNLWGVRLFEEGQVSAERRLKRGMRRRIARRKKRLQLLRDIFSDEILKFDDSFFIRMDESFYQNDDAIKTVKTHYPLFNGKTGSGETYDNEVDYYKAYPTIYHLRNRLITDRTQADLRLVYLALHHILKFRGHFTNQGQTFDLKNINVAESLQELLELFDTITNDFDFNFDADNEEEANVILTNRNFSRKKKADELTELYNNVNDENFAKHENIGTKKQIEKFLETKNAQMKALFTAIVGNSIDIAKIFEKKEEYKLSDDNNLPKGADFKYGNENFDEKLSELESVILPEEVEILIIGKKVYEAIVLSGILTKETLAASMVEKFDHHKQQLEELKAFTRTISDDLFAKFFKEDGIYTNFIEGKGNPAKTTSRDDFYKEIKKAFETEFKGLKFPDVDKAFDFSKTDLTSEQEKFLADISELMKFENYLPKQRQSDNGAIPYQVHEHELRLILKNQGQYYDFLKDMVDVEEENEDGEVRTKQEYKIQVLFKFRIPYYVGTLAQNAGWERAENGELIQTNSSAKNSWLVRQSDEKLTPWTFDKVIDKENSAVNFIERMTNFDTYLPSEKVLPKNSLLYQEFSIYNELIIGGYYQNGHKNWFSPELRQKIVEKLFKTKKSVSAKDMINFLKNECHIVLNSPKELFGIDTFVKSPKYNTSYSTYLDLIKIEGITYDMIAEHRDVFEQIIKWQTIFEDKKVLRKTIKNANKDEWHNLLTEEQVKKLGSRHYTGWGRLSKKLLEGLKAENGKTIIDNLKTENYRNFMRLLEDKNIAEAIKSAQVEKLDDASLNYGMVENLAGSPAIKKGIWQSLQIIKELESYLGRENISKIVVEMARENGNGRTKTRQRQIEDYYNKFIEKTKESIKDVRDYSEDDFQKVKKEFEKILDAHRFDDEKVFLYFLQNGKSMYGGEDLDLDRLPEYEVDHIVPQTYIKDDSFDNKVLVLKSENQNKGGDVPSKLIITKMRDYWELLAKNGQVSPRKLANLKLGHLSDERKSGFINRQLVETRQITKHVANILSNYFDKSAEILTPKASLTKQFRHGEVFVDAKTFNFEVATNNQIHYEYDNEAFLPNGEITETAYKDSNFVKVHVHEGFPKNRDLNDYHHAHDAYLNAVVANYIYETRPDLHDMWVYGEYQRKAQKEIGKHGVQRQNYYKQLLADMIDEKWLRYYYDKNTKETFTTGEFWRRDEVIDKIKRNLGLRNVNVVKQATEGRGQFLNESVYQKSEGLRSLKGNRLSNRYGGMKSIKEAYSTIISFVDETGNPNIKCVSIPIIDRIIFERNPISYISNIRPNWKGIKILYKLKNDQLILDSKGRKLLFRSTNEATGETFFNKGNQLKFELNDIKLINKLSKSKNETRFTNAEQGNFLRIYTELVEYMKEQEILSTGSIKALKGGKDEFISRRNVNVSEGNRILSYGKKEILLGLIDYAAFGKIGSKNAAVASVAPWKTDKNGKQKRETINNKDIKIGESSNMDSYIIIHQSITGLYETREKLKWDGE